MSEPFTIKSTSMASWAMGKLAEARDLIARDRVEMLAERERLTRPAIDWVNEQTIATQDAHNRRTANAARTAAFMEGVLLDWWANAVFEQLGEPDLDENGDPLPPTLAKWERVTKSIPLTHGKVAATRLPGTWEFVDEDAFIEFLTEAAPDLLARKLGPKKAIVEHLMVKDGRVFFDGEEVVVPVQHEPSPEEAEQGAQPTEGTAPVRIVPPRPEIKITVTPSEWTPPPAGIVLPDPPDAPQWADEGDTPT